MDDPLKLLLFDGRYTPADVRVPGDACPCKSGPGGILKAVVGIVRALVDAIVWTLGPTIETHINTSRHVDKNALHSSITEEKNDEATTM